MNDFKCLMVKGKAPVEALPTVEERGNVDGTCRPMASTLTVQQKTGTVTTLGL